MGAPARAGERGQAVKILRMGTSQDVAGRVAEADLAHRIVERRLSEALGQPVETVVRRAWPNAKMPVKFAEYLEREEPDLVFFVVPAYWVCYESVPLRFERALGRLGKPFADAGLKAAGTPWLAENFAFRALRNAANNTIGGATHFTPAEVTTVLAECLRLALRNENRVVVMRGPRGAADTATSPRARRRIEARRSELQRLLAETCGQLHIEYWATERPQWQVEQGHLLGDGLHRNADGHRTSANREFDFLLQAWERHHGSIGPN